MKYMKIEDLEKGDIIKLNVEFLVETDCADFFITLAKKYNAIVEEVKLYTIRPIHIYIRFVNDENRPISNDYFLPLGFSKNVPFEIVELAK